MQYSIDTLSIEIARLQKTIRKMKLLPPNEEQTAPLQDRINEFEGQIRELRKAIGVLKEFVKSSSNGQQQQYTSRYIDQANRQG